jgi:hypothetical protein
MGTSTDAILAFGFDLGEQEELPDALLAACRDDDEGGFAFDSLVAKEIGLVEPTHGNYEAPEWPAHWKAKREAEAAYPLDLIGHCSGDYRMWFLAVRGTEQRARRGSPVAINELPQPPADRIEAMRAFCEGYGIEWQEPRWYIFSDWF